MADFATTPPTSDYDEMAERARRRARLPLTRLYQSPWWLLFFIALAVYVFYQIAIDEQYSRAFNQIRGGVSMTLSIALGAYAIALIIGLLTGLVRSITPMPAPLHSPLRRRLAAIAFTILHNLVTFYIELMRGLPTLVFLLVMGFVIVPALEDSINANLVPLLRDVLNNPEIPEMVWRGRDPLTAIVGLALVYGAFLSEVFRAGIQSIDKGQIEAGKSLGMNWLQVMRFIVIPQAVRLVLPPLGNDFIAMIKDTALVTILGTNDVTQEARKWAGSSFRYLETYFVLCAVYLAMTISGSLLVQWVERRINNSQGHQR